MFSPPRKSYTALLSELIGARSIPMALRGASVIRPQSSASFQSTSLESATPIPAETRPTPPPSKPAILFKRRTGEMF